MVLSRDILISLLLNIKVSENVTKDGHRPLKIPIAPMIHLGTYLFKYFKTVKITPKEYFTNAYVYEVFKLEHICNSTKGLCKIWDAKYRKEDLNKAKKNKF